ncbi:MAG: VPLPA-CTERM sorting domain-containing protein [Roseobacter sp.]
MTSDDSYDNSETVAWANSHGSGGLVGTTTLAWGEGDLYGKADDNLTNDSLFLYVEVPLGAKDTTWGSGTSDGYVDGGKKAKEAKKEKAVKADKKVKKADKKVKEAKSAKEGKKGGTSTTTTSGSNELAFGKATGSENVTFKGIEVKYKLVDGVGHEVKSGDNLITEVRTSLDYIIGNFGSDYWGDGSNSLKLEDHEANGWPSKASWEFQFDLATILEEFGSSQSFIDMAKTDINFHLSPGKNGVTDIGQCEVDCDPPSAVPLPASLPLLAAGLGGILALTRRRKKRS